MKNIENLSDLLFRRGNVSEDAVMAAGDAGAAVGDVAEPSTAAPSGDAVAAPSGAISAGDVLGKDCDHQKDGYLGTNCFHVPSSVLPKGKVMKRWDKEILSGKKKKDHKNPYTKGMKILSDSEMNSQLLNAISKLDGADITEFALKMFKSAEDKQIIYDSGPVQVCYCPPLKEFFFKLSRSPLGIPYFFVADFDASSGKIIPSSSPFIKTYKLMTAQEAKSAFDHILHSSEDVGTESMNLWTVWE